MTKTLRQQKIENSRRYRHDNPEKVNAYNRKWNEEHPLRRKATDLLAGAVYRAGKKSNINVDFVYDLLGNYILESTIWKGLKR